MGKDYRKLVQRIITAVTKQRKIAFALSVVVVFIATYLLILPAMTLEQDEAQKQGGIDIATEQVVTEEAAPAEGSLSCDGKGFSVEAAFDAKAGLPLDTQLTAEEITKADEDYAAYCDEALKALQEKDGEQIADLKFAKIYDISLAAGEEQIEPDAPVAVSISFDKGPAVAEADRVRIVHFTQDKKGNPVTEILDADDVSVDVKKGKMTEASFAADSFSVYAVVYTVDFHYEVNGETFEYSIEGGGSILLSELLAALGADVELAAIADVTFSDPDLIEISQTGDDWKLQSLKAFDTEESLTVYLENGDQFVVRVTDAQEIPDAEKASLDVSKSYLICYEVTSGSRTTYYLLKNDGTVDSSYHPDFEGDPDSAHDFEHLNSTYAWNFNHIFKEQDVEHHLDKNYYLIRPIDNLAKTLTLNNAGEDLVQQGNNNIAVIQSGDGFILEGYHNVGTEDAHRYIHLGFNSSGFAGIDGDGVTVRIYEMDALPTYDYTVRSADETRGTVTVEGGTQQTEHHEGAPDTHYYDATSGHDKKNAGTITATPVTHTDTGGRNKWEFDHWELDGLPLDRNQYPATIQAAKLPIPHNGSNLVAYFKQNPEYDVPKSEKEPSSIEDMSKWLDGLKSREIPLVDSETNKTAEVYDYQNRIYRVDFTSKANFETFAGNLDMAFCLDVSNSMKFPSKLDEAKKNFSIYHINDNNTTKQQLNQNTVYYLVGDASKTSTVYRLFYYNRNWYAMDESKYVDQTRNTAAAQKNQVAAASGDSFTIGTQEYRGTKWPFTSGDTAGSTYTIYTAGDHGYDRFHYLNLNFSNGAGELNTIQELLRVAGDESPGVQIAYNTFNKLKQTTVDFGETVFNSDGTLSLDDLANDADGGTRPDLAFDDALTLDWSGDSRYVILVTDGAPQGGDKRADTTSTDRFQYARDAAARLKKGPDGIAGTDDDIKLITIGLSMDKVEEGKVLLYDLADKDSSGNKMFYLAESGNDLGNIFRKITKTLMEDAVVIGDVTDTVGEAFYLVDKATGLPLKAGNTVDIEGNLTTDASKIAGVVQADGRTIKWTNQAIDSVAGWHGTAYVKAKEELVGGNAVKTNDGNATVVATKYHAGNKEYNFDTTLVRDTLKLRKDLPSPRVNVNELTFFDNNTEWTVYLGAEVDPKEQLKALYDSLVVEEVVNTNGSLHYKIEPNTIEERWNDDIGTAATFSLPGLIERLIRQNPALETKYFSGSELNWDAFLRDSLSGGITLPYHEYGLTDDGNIKITLEKTIASGEEGDLIDRSPHATMVTGSEVEKYVFRIAYEPDYTVTPIGQGGQSTEDFHTGTFGTMYQGHATGRESTTNTHIINVFAKKLQILKTDQTQQMITGGNEATFGLYRKLTDEEIQSGTTGKTLPGLQGSYAKVQTLTTENGVVTTDPLKLLTSTEDYNTDYYLVEESAPAGFNLLPDILKVSVDMSENSALDHNTWTPKDTSIRPTHNKPNPYVLSDWTQQATIKVTDLAGRDSGYAVRVLPEGVREVTYDSVNDTTDASVTYKIINTAGVELPASGGPGTTWIYLIGSILLLGCGTLLIARRRTGLQRQDRP